MKDDKRSVSKHKKRELFAISESEAMRDEVSDAARILRGFTSQVDLDAAKDSEPLLFGDHGFTDSLALPKNKTSTLDDLDTYIESANWVAAHLEVAGVTIIPRIVVKNNDGQTYDPGLSRQIANGIRLYYKGKAAKKQLERLRQKVIQTTQRSSDRHLYRTDKIGVSEKK
jgi:hypothetical protein